MKRNLHIFYVSVQRVRLFQANPLALLSNIQYVGAFYGNQMEGIEAYWWTQFSGAVEFIKTLLSRNL